MPTAIEKRLNAIERMLKELSGRIEQRPVVDTGNRAPDLFISITGGNVLTGGEQGIKFAIPNVASVPSAYDPNVTTSFIDGIGRGRLYRNGLLNPDYVLVVNDQRGTFQQALLSGDVLYTTGTASIPVSGGGFVLCYTTT